MLTIRCCAPETPKYIPKLPKRLARLRRTIESKRMDNIKKIHEDLKRTAKEEQQVIRDFFNSLREEEADEEEPKPVEAEWIRDE